MTTTSNVVALPTADGTPVDNYAAQASALTPLYEPDWSVYRRMALFIAIIGVQARKGVNDDGPRAYTYAKFDDIRATINPLAYRCGIFLEYSDNGNPTIYNMESGHAESTACVRAVNIDKPEEKTAWATHTGLAFSERPTDTTHGNKANTQALKYATIKALNLPTGEADGDEGKGQAPVDPSKPAEPPKATPANGKPSAPSRKQIDALRRAFELRNIDEATHLSTYLPGLTSLEDPRMTTDLYNKIVADGRANGDAAAATKDAANASADGGAPAEQVAINPAAEPAKAAPAEAPATNPPKYGQPNFSEY